MDGATDKDYFKKVEYAITNRQQFNVKTYKYLSAERTLIDKVTRHYLDALGLQWLNNRLSYCIHELATNAHKANTKRVYFEALGLNLYSEADYARGMQRFKDETFLNLEHYLKLQRQADLHVLFNFQLKHDVLTLQIRNNTASTQEEQQRSREKLAIAARYDNLADAYEISEDYSEGAGLGIVMLSLMLNTPGAGKNALRFSFGESETSADIELDLLRMRNRPAVDGVVLYA